MKRDLILYREVCFDVFEEFHTTQDEREYRTIAARYS